MALTLLSIHVCMDLPSQEPAFVHSSTGVMRDVQEWVGSAPNTADGLWMCSISLLIGTFRHRLFFLFIISKRIKQRWNTKVELYHIH